MLGRLSREGTSSVGALATAERVRPQSMAQTVADLEAAGLISRRPDPADGRRTLVELTPEGRVTLEADRRDREGWLASAIGAELSAAGAHASSRAPSSCCAASRRAEPGHSPRRARRGSTKRRAAPSQVPSGSGCSSPGQRPVARLNATREP